MKTLIITMLLLQLVTCNVITYYQIDSTTSTSNTSTSDYYSAISLKYSDLYKHANNLCVNEKYCVLIDNRIKKIAIGQPKMNDIECATDNLNLYLQIDNNSNLSLRERTELFMNSKILDKLNEICYVKQNKITPRTYYARWLSVIFTVFLIIISSYTYYCDKLYDLNQSHAHTHAHNAINDCDIYYLSSSDDDLVIDDDDCDDGDGSNSSSN